MISFLFGAAGGLAGALGLGGGSLLLICLVSIQGMEQLMASGVNLLVFLPTGGLSLLLHHRNGLVRWRLVLPAAAAGAAGVVLGSGAAGLLPQELLSRIFGWLLLAMGIWELAGCFKKNKGLHNRPPEGTN